MFHAAWNVFTAFAAAFRCNAYTRALKYFESYLREVRTNWQKRYGSHSSPPSSSEGAGLSFNQGGGLTAADLGLLQHIYSRVDDRDGMSGIAALRTSQPTMAERMRDLESQGHWAEALTCYEQVRLFCLLHRHDWTRLFFVLVFAN